MQTCLRCACTKADTDIWRLDGISKQGDSPDPAGRTDGHESAKQVVTEIHRYKENITPVSYGCGGRMKKPEFFRDIRDELCE